MAYAKNGDVRIYYEVEGSGPALMLHNGFLGVGKDWDMCGYVDALKADYRLILVDPRGQGQSDKPHAPIAYGRTQLAADVIAVLDAVEVDRVDFWGYSMGAGLGYRLALARPDRFRSMVLGGGHPFAGTASGWVEPLRQGRLAELLDGEFFAELSTEARERWLRESDQEALAAHQVAAAEEPSMEAQLADIRLPTLIYYGDRDTPMHDKVRLAVEGMPSATFVSLAGLDHLAAFNSSGIVIPHVRSFLNN